MVVGIGFSIIFLCFFLLGQKAEAADTGLSYRTQIQNYGWQEFVKDGETSGTIGQELRLEGIEIKVDSELTGDISYRTHIQDFGWEKEYKTNGQMSGTSGSSKRLEAIQVKLDGALAASYDVYYRVHAQNFGWLDWAKNGHSAGTEGYAYRLEAIQIKLVKKGDTAPGKTATPFAKKEQPTDVSYRTHVESYGWQKYVLNGQMSGTKGQSKRLEGIDMKVTSPYSGAIEYRTHIQNIGWEKEFKKNGQMSGTSGQSKRLEAIQIRLTGELAARFDVYYRVHAQNFGWMGWAKNGASAGTASYGYRLEGIEIKLVKRGDKAPAPTENAFRDKSGATVKKYAVSIRYEDLEDREVLETTTIQVASGEQYVALAPEIEGYQLQGANVQTIEAVSADGTLTFNYKSLEEIALTGYLYNAKNELLSNEKIDIKKDGVVVETVTTDEEGYFFTHFIIGETYTLHGIDFEVTVIANGFNDFTVNNLRGRIAEGKEIVNENGTLEVSASTISLDQNQMDYSVSEDFQELTAEGDVDLKVGDVVYLEGQENYLGGLGLKVASVTTVNGQTVAKAEPAELGEVISTIQGEVVDKAVTEGQFVPADGVVVEDSTMKRDVSAGITASIKYEAGPFSFNGKLKVTGSIDAKVDVNPFDLGNATLIATPKLTISLDGEMGLSAKNETIKKNIGTIYVPSGIPGVSVNIPLDLVFTVDGKVKVELGVDSTLTIRVGYEKGKIIKESTITTEADSSAKGEISVKAGVQGSVSLAVLTQIEGLKLSVGAGAKCTTSIEYLIDRPIIKVSGEIGAYANFKYCFPILKVIKADYGNEVTLYEHSWKLKEIATDFSLTADDYSDYPTLKLGSLRDTLRKAIRIVDNPEKYVDDEHFQLLRLTMSSSGSLLRGYSAQELVEHIVSGKEFNDSQGNRYFVSQEHIDQIEMSVSTIISQVNEKIEEPTPPVEEEFLDYRIDAGEVRITGFLYGKERKDIVIPNVIVKDGQAYPVTTIGTEAFLNKKLTSVVFPDSLKHIWEDAFKGNCLTIVKLPPGVTFHTSPGNGWPFDPGVQLDLGSLFD